MAISTYIKFAFGPIVAAGVSVLTLPVLTWFFQTDDIGKYSYFQAVSSGLLLMVVLGLDQAYVREYYKESNKTRLFAITLIPCVVFLLFISALHYVVGSGIISELLGLSTTGFALVLVFVFFSLILRFILLFFRVRSEGGEYSVLMLTPKLAFLTAVLLFLLLDITLENLLPISLTIAMIFSSVIGCLLLNSKRAFDYPIKIRDETAVKFKELIRFSTPLWFSSICYWGLTSVDRILINKLSNLDELAIFSVAASFAGAATILQSVFSTIWSPMIYKWSENDDGVNVVRFERIINIMTVLVVFISACISLFSFVLEFLLPKEYYEIRYFVVLCMCSPFFYTLSEATVVGIGVVRKSIYTFISILSALLVSVSTLYLLVPLHGAKGAAFANAVGFLVLFLLRTYFSRLLWVKFKVRKTVFICFCILALAFMSAYFPHTYKYVNFCWLLLLSIALYIYREECRELLAMIKKVIK